MFQLDVVVAAVRPRMADPKRERRVLLDRCKQQRHRAQPTLRQHRETLRLQRLLGLR